MVALGVIGPDAALVAVPQLDRAPVVEQAGEQLVGESGRATAGEREVRDPAALESLAQRARDLVRGVLGRGVRIGEGAQAGHGTRLGRGGERWRVGGVAQERLADPLAEDAGLAAGGAEDRPLVLAPGGVTTVCVQAAGPAVQAQAQPGGGLQVESGEPAHLLLGGGLQAQRDVLAASHVGLAGERPVVCHQRTELPAAGGRRASRSAASRRSRSRGGGGS